MDTRTTKRTAKGTSKTVRHERPPVKPIPMQPLKQNSTKTSPVTSAIPEAPLLLKMGLESYYVISNVENFLLRKPNDPLPSTRKPRQRVNMKIKIGGGLTIKGSHATEKGENDKPVELTMKKAPCLTEMCKKMKTKVNTYLGRKPVTFCVNGVQINMTRSAKAYKSAYLAAFTGLKPAVDPEYKPWKKLAHHFNCAVRAHISWPTLDEYGDEWAKMKNQNHVSKYEISGEKIAEKLGITLKEFQAFELHEGITFESLRKATHCRYVPDLIKQLAFSAWQRREYDECDYYLAEAQGCFLNREITDQQKIFICRTEEHRSKHRTLASEEAIKDVYQFQTSDLNNFASTREAFKSNVQLINPDWHVVQLSSLFQYRNRFGSSITGPTKTQAMFLSALILDRGTNKRSIYTTFVNEPKLDPAVTKLGIHEQMQIVEQKNARLNEVANIQTKNIYWSSRSEHNKRMRRLLYFLQRWIEPWTFLLPGNIKDTTIIDKILKLLTQLSKTYRPIFTDRIAGVLYKLIENYNVLNEKVKSQLSVLVGCILNVPKSQKLNRFSKKIAELGATIKRDSPRNPTILVLDQDLMQFPWECMHCMLLTKTDVTRVPSLAMLHSLIRLNECKFKGCEEIDVDKCTYVVNPDGTLKKVEDRMRQYFENRKKWTGFVGEMPSPNEAERAIEEQDLVVYCGHGSGSQIFTESALNRQVCRSLPMLMGCGSVRLKPEGPHASGWSSINAYFGAACRGVIGFLWEVTDLECDRLTTDIIERLAPDPDARLPEVFRKDGIVRLHETDLATCVRLCRNAAKQHMTFASIVYYGIPLSCKRKTRKATAASVKGG